MTISKTGMRTATVSSHHAHCRIGRRFARREVSGLTLLEILLAVSILVFLFAAVSIGLRSLSSHGAVSDAVDNFAVGLRLTRAEAASKGKRLRLTFDEENGGKIQIEADPVKSPGQFMEYKACTWSERLTSPLLRVTASRLTGQSALNTLGQFAEIENDENNFQDITFNPDGSCDSAEITLAARDEDDTRRFIVKLDGMGGKTLMEVTDSTAEDYNGEDDTEED